MGFYLFFCDAVVVEAEWREVCFTKEKLSKIGLAASKSPAQSKPPATNSRSKQSPSASWRKRLFSFGKQRKSLSSVAPAPQPVVGAVAVVGWERGRAQKQEARERKRAMSAPNPPEEGVEEMETDMSPEPNCKYASQCERGFI